MTVFKLTLVLVLGTLLLLACGRSEAPPAPLEAKAPAAKGGQVVTRPVWEQKWEATIAEARKEGVVSIYSLWTPGTKDALARAFKQKYGIELEFSPFSRGADLAAKTAAEKRAGLYLSDIYGPGNPTLLLNMKPDGILGPIQPLLLLPEALDSKVWLGGSLPLVDREGTALSMIGSVMRNVVYNTDLVKDGEITNYKDLLKPQYKGKLILNDPSVAGGSNAMLAHLGENLWGEEETASFLRKLLREQEVVIQRDHRVHIEWIARGKNAIGISPLREIISEFRGMGAPVKLAANLPEDNRLSPSTGTLGVAARPAHPNATLVFVNWLLTKEGQSVFATSFGAPSTRQDASIQGIDPVVIPVAGQKYYGESQEAMDARAKWLEMAKKIMGESTK